MKIFLRLVEVSFHKSFGLNDIFIYVYILKNWIERIGAQVIGVLVILGLGISTGIVSLFYTSYIPIQPFANFFAK